MKKEYDVVILIEWAVGNTIEALYAVEYCLANNKKAGIVLNKVSNSFKEYLKECYGENIILDNCENIKTTNLIHVFIHHDEFDIEFENYFYVYPDFHSSKYQSETEQYLSIVKALYPSEYQSYTLNKLIGIETERVRTLDIKNKYVFYHGSANHTVVKRWPHYIDLMNQLGAENCIFVGGGHELDFTYSYLYPKYITKIFSKKFTNNIKFWNLNKQINLLKPYTNYHKIINFKNAFLNTFNWKELVYIFRKSKAFVGNDGGLMHLASAAGAKGIAIFGPSSLEKNKSYNPSIKEIHKKYDCQPCQFNIKEIPMARYFIACPYQIKCLNDITTEQIIYELQKI